MKQAVEYGISIYIKMRHIQMQLKNISSRISSSQVLGPHPELNQQSSVTPPYYVLGWPPTRLSSPSVSRVEVTLALLHCPTHQHLSNSLDVSTFPKRDHITTNAFPKVLLLQAQPLWGQKGMVSISNYYVQQVKSQWTPMTLLLINKVESNSSPEQCGVIIKNE